MRLADLATPTLLLDRARLEANCIRMRDRCRALAVGLRPHMKTLKSIDAARIAIDPTHGGIAVSTLKEAEYFADHGIADIQLAVCITADKLPRAAALSRRIPCFSCFVGGADAANAVAAFAAAEGVPLRVWIEVDSGQHRTGTAPDGEELIAIARVLAGSPAQLAGVATHAGHSYDQRSCGAIAAIAEEERSAVTGAAQRLREAGFTIEGVSAGSTPTAVHTRSGAGLTELRPGVYMAGDLFQAAIGSHGADDIAVSVLSTVISHGRDPDRLILDAGALALSKDRSTAALEGGDLGYGLIADPAGQRVYGDLVVTGVNQEHGEVAIADRAVFARLPIGVRVAVFPNHACMTTAMHDRYIVMEDGRPVGIWAKTGGW
jgi:D-serine deaminase-like pyridoxal phosphate-dependent protein